MALRPEPYHVLELCAGAGGLGLGIELAVPGARGVAYVEREAYAAATLVARMEEGCLAPAPVWSDLATFDARPWRGRVHCVASGDPCQPNSVAGRGLGADDERFLLARAIEIYADSGADRFFRENVTGNADGQLAVAVPLLEGLGCRVAAGIVRASDVGASHQRERLIIMADRQNERPERPGLSWRRGFGSADCGGTLVYAPGDGRGEGRAGPELRRGRHSAAGAGGELGHANGADVARRRAGGDPVGREEPAGYAGLAGGSVEPDLCPDQSSLRWLDILDADPLRRPALGRIDLWAIARRDHGLPPVVAAVGRRGGMAWDLDAATTALVGARFAEYLMGWPLGWTDCASAATASTRWQRHMRGLLSTLCTPTPAAQGTLL